MSADATFQGRVKDASRQEGSLHGIGGLTRAEELLDPEHQRVEEPRSGRGRQVREGGDDPRASAADRRGEGRIIDVPVQDQGRGAEAVGVFDDEGDRVPQLGLADSAEGRAVIARVLLDVAGVSGLTPPDRAPQKVPRPDSLVAGLPDGVAFQTGHRLDPLGLALEVAPFGHALERFERVEAVDLDVASGRHDGPGHGETERDFERRKPPGHRQARSGHQREPQLASRLHHLKRLGTAIGEMLIIEDGHGAAGGAEDVGDRAIHLPSRVELLELVVERIIAVLADQEDRVHRELSGPERERVGDRRGEPDVVPLCLVATKIGLVRGLLDEEARHVAGRVVEAAPVVEDEAVEEAADDVVGVREVVVNRRDRRDFGPRRVRRGESPGLSFWRQSGHADRGARRSEKRPPRRLQSHRDLSPIALSLAGPGPDRIGPVHRTVNHQAEQAGINEG